MKTKPLPHNTLILNGHKLHSLSATLIYASKRLGISPVLTSIEALVAYLQDNTIHIAIRHPDTFLCDETIAQRAQYLQQLKQHMILS